MITYTDASPAVQRAVKTYNATWEASSLEAPLLSVALAAVLNEHDSGLRKRLSLVEAALAGEMRKTARLRKKLRRAKAVLTAAGALLRCFDGLGVRS